MKFSRRGLTLEYRYSIFSLALSPSMGGSHALLLLIPPLYLGSGRLAGLAATVEDNDRRIHVDKELNRISLTSISVGVFHPRIVAGD